MKTRETHFAKEDVTIQRRMKNLLVEVDDRIMIPMRRKNERPSWNGGESGTTRMMMMTACREDKGVMIPKVRRIQHREEEENDVMIRMTKVARLLEDDNDDMIRTLLPMDSNDGTMHRTAKRTIIHLNDVIDVDMIPTILRLLRLTVTNACRRVMPLDSRVPATFARRKKRF
jgi:hypothetical protein